MLFKKNINLGKISLNFFILILFFLISFNIQSDDNLEGNFTDIKILDKISSKNFLLKLKNGEDTKYKDISHTDWELPRTMRREYVEYFNKYIFQGYRDNLCNENKFKEDLDNNWAVVAEAIQTILRREGYPNPYEALKGLTRTNEKINQDSIANFIEELKVTDEIKLELKRITPSNYTGI